MVVVDVMACVPAPPVEAPNVPKGLPAVLGSFSRKSMAETTRLVSMPVECRKGAFINGISKFQHI